ncbi:MAG TPA: patatin-like phospholipase family protein [Actinomycetota bacterium]
MTLGLVLGGGGLVGMGYHAGVLKALDDVGVDPALFDVIVGTSAGSVIGSYLATGWTLSDFFEYAHGRHARAEHDEAGQRDEVRRMFEPLWHSRGERIRRGIGSTFAVASARGYWSKASRGRVPGTALRRAFPSGLYSTEESRRRLHEDLPDQWPSRTLYVCAADLYTGQRVVFGRDGAPPARLADAVLASTAIPGLFPPVRIGERQYVDGGIVSASSLDLAVEAGCDAILCVAPLGYRNEGGLPEPKMWGPMIVRSLFARSLRREVMDARRRGVEVLVIRPWVTELVAQGTNSMRHFDRGAVVDAAREGALRLLDDHSDHAVLRAGRAPRPAKKKVSAGGS